MFLFRKPTSILFVYRDSLVFLSSSSLPLNLTYPKEVMEFGIIKNEEEFTSFTREFIVSTKSKNQRIIFLLSKDLVYYKIVEQKDRSHLSEFARGFLEKVPVEEQYSIKTAAETKAGTMLYVADRRLPEKLVSIGKSFGWNVFHIMPELLLGIDSSKKSDVKALIQKVLSAIHTYPQSDFKKVL